MRYNDLIIFNIISRRLIIIKCINIINQRKKEGKFKHNYYNVF